MKTKACTAMALLALLAFSQTGPAMSAGDSPDSTDKPQFFKPEDSTTPRTGAPVEGSTGKFRDDADNEGRTPSREGADSYIHKETEGGSATGKGVGIGPDRSPSSPGDDGMGEAGKGGVGMGGSSRTGGPATGTDAPRTGESGGEPR